MSLENYYNRLIEQGHLKKEKIGLDQVKALFKSAQKNLIASKKTLSIDEETCYAMAYTAMLKVARAVIFLEGYRPDDGQQHKTTVAVAGKILGKDFDSLIAIFDRMRKKRNQFTYDPLLPLSKMETKNALKIAEEFFEKVRRYIENVDSQERLF